jgi:hypothetical protein
MNKTVAALALAGLCTSSLMASRPATCDLTVVVDGVSRPELAHHGTTYVEAVRGRAYVLRLTNPTPYRVAVALSVDGLNTIDARHTDAWTSAKWVLEPYESTEIAGWQVSDQAARRFVFTGERQSYGAALGVTENLGVIEAVFYRERIQPVEIFREDGNLAPSSAAGAAPPPPSKQAAPADDYAATGMGQRTRHEVERVQIELDPQPIASHRVRYEFHPQLVKLGVVTDAPRPLDRRERARGFEGYCPEPN